MVTVLFLFFAALTMLFLAVVALIRARRLEQITKVNERMNALAFKTQDAAVAQTTEPGWTEFLGRWLARVGLPINSGTAIVILGTVLTSGWLLWQQVSVGAAVLWWGVAMTAGIFIPQIRYAKKINKLVSQIPLFIDQVIRGLVTGRNVEGAIKLAVEDTQEPLLSVMARAQRTVELGADLGDALRDAASFYDVKELHMVALAVHSSRVYGGSPREMLESVVSLIRQREQVQRELRAMTGETRVTAWVLGITPLLVAGYVLVTSPGMFQPMLDSETGRFILMLAAGMQALGALTLWRMIKSI